MANADFGCLGSHGLPYGKPQSRNFLVKILQVTVCSPQRTVVREAAALRLRPLVPAPRPGDGREGWGMLLSCPSARNSLLWPGRQTAIAPSGHVRIGRPLRPAGRMAHRRLRPHRAVLRPPMARSPYGSAPAELSAAPDTAGRGGGGKLFNRSRRCCRRRSWR